MSDSERCNSSGYRFMIYTDHINAENPMPSLHNAREIDRNVILCYHNPPYDRKSKNLISGIWILDSVGSFLILDSEFLDQIFDIVKI